MAEEWVTQRELDQLRAEVIRLDDHGPRGVGTLQTQLADMNNRFREHQRQHEREQADRAVNRRWGISLAVIMLGAIGGLYPYFLAIAHK